MKYKIKIIFDTHNTIYYFAKTSTRDNLKSPVGNWGFCFPKQEEQIIKLSLIQAISVNSYIKKRIYKNTWF